jgi:hypothetical protein
MLHRFGLLPMRRLDLSNLRFRDSRLKPLFFDLHLDFGLRLEHGDFVRLVLAVLKIVHDLRQEARAEAQQ